ncbi:MAG: thiamine diphosphokinase [Bacteroidota bacterium]
MKKCIIIANGYAAKKSAITFLQRKGYSDIICADGGANSAFKIGIIPNCIIGDLDSISPEVYKYFSKRTMVLKLKRQNDTDVEKALKYALKNKYDEAILLGVTGDRLDHSFCNLGIAIKYSDKIKIRIIHEKSLLDVYKGVISLDTTPNETLSIYGIDDKTKITSVGLKYRLNNTTLPFGKKESTSNIALGSIVKLKIKHGKIFVIRNFQTLKHNGLF